MTTVLIQRDKEQPQVEDRKFVKQIKIPISQKTVLVTEEM